MQIYFNAPEAIEFLKNIGYTVERTEYKEYHDGGRVCEDSIDDKNVLLAYKEYPEKLKKMLGFTNDTKSGIYYHEERHFDEWSIERVFNQEFKARLLKLLVKSNTQDLSELVADIEE